MRQKNTIIALSFTTFILPFVYIYYTYGKISPFDLKGPQFLVFYLMLGGIGIPLSILQNYLGSLFARNTTVRLVIAVGFARCLQGGFNHKPVGYLVIIMIAFIVIFNFLNRQNYRRSKPS